MIAAALATGWNNLQAASSGSELLCCCICRQTRGTTHHRAMLASLPCQDPVNRSPCCPEARAALALKLLTLMAPGQPCRVLDRPGLLLGLLPVIALLVVNTA